LREAHVFSYKDYKIIGMPMPSSGGHTAAPDDVNDQGQKYQPHGLSSQPQSVQLMVEAERRAFADRAEYMGDADFYKVPVNMLSR
jgi:gamma-glutamyltranspeptidase/glutathione hydrolase